MQFFQKSNGQKIAYHYNARSQESPVVVFLSGYRSDQFGTKALFLDDLCAQHTISFLRFDYSGCGHSEGSFDSQSLADWLQDTKDLIEHLGLRKIILIGSSMGGWLSLLLINSNPSFFISGFIGIAPAPDFVRDIERTADAHWHKTIREKGYVGKANADSDELYMTNIFYQQAFELCILDQIYQAQTPMILLQGKKDQSVPWQKTLDIQKAYPMADCDIRLIEDGDHRLSRPQDLEVLKQALLDLLAKSA
jgi:pimeloyl-ACP methyl ester carboxylesterase